MATLPITTLGKILWRIRHVWGIEPKVYVAERKRRYFVEYPILWRLKHQIRGLRYRIEGWLGGQRLRKVEEEHRQMCRALQNICDMPEFTHRVKMGGWLHEEVPRAVREFVEEVRNPIIVGKKRLGEDR